MSVPIINLYDTWVLWVLYTVKGSLVEFSAEPYNCFPVRENL